jgi:hypothetical protein
MLDPYIDKKPTKGLEITPKTKVKFCCYNQSCQLLKILKGVQIDDPNVQNFENGSEKFSPARTDGRRAPPSALKRQTLGRSGGLLLLLLPDDRKLHF